MTEKDHEQIRHMLNDAIDNMEKPDEYPSHADFKHDWLQAVADAASGLANGRD